ncbi:MAG: substrate-binding domain-containing protein [Ruminococcus sp.]|nr:substrate-binding domain-containing protein [Ruminococcus sp.]
MLHGKRPTIGVITAKATDSEQKQILSGILTQAEKIGADVVILTNIYDYYQYYTEIEIENKIYELISSEKLDGLIFTAESINNEALTQTILKHIKNRTKIPVVVTGAEIEGFTCIDNDVKSDFIDIAHHLTDVHGFTKIDMLAGYEWHDSNKLRIEGMCSVLNENGVLFDENNVIYGNYWTDSGEKLAMEYINGTRPIPEAVVCANDYMAFGIIDTFFEHNIYPPKDIAVIGYEHIGDRIYHSPILTTYRRNRYALGQKAVNMVFSEITGTPMEDIPVNGCMICGDTCTCGVNRNFLGNELNIIRRTQFYYNMNFSGNFEQRSSSCRSLDEYINVLREFSFLIRDVDGIYLCLYENWCSQGRTTSLEENSNSETMVCYRIISPEKVDDKPLFFTRGSLCPSELPGSGGKGFYYFVSIFSAGTDLGHIILQYTHPDVFDPIFIDWHQAAINALCSLQMRNDINLLLECRNLSEFHDSATGLYNKAGLIHELDMVSKHSSENDNLLIILIRTSLFNNDIRIDEQHSAVRIDTELSDNFRRLTYNSKEFLAKISDKLYAFAAIGNYNDDISELIIDKINAVICHSPLYIQKCGIDSYVCAASVVPYVGVDVDRLIKKLSDDLTEKIRILSVKRENSQYCAFLNTRSMMYLNPNEDWDAQKLCRDYHLSYGHFRATYKDFFGTSFHKDLIASRITYAKYLLITTSVSLSTIAYKCGYDDEKYFMRQFRQITGFTPNNYRDAKNYT